MTHKHTTKADVKNLSILGGGTTKPARSLETFPNKHPGRDYMVTLESNEFTCLCPVTGQPDFARIEVRYVPNKRIVESKSLKLYLWSFRSEGIFHEHLANIILDDLVEALKPRWCEVLAKFNSRGGISIKVHAEHKGK